MDGLLRTLTRSRNSPTRGGDGRGRNRRDNDNDNGGGGGRNRQFELILEMLARGLVEYAVRKYVPGHSNGGDNRERRQDDRLRARDHRDDRGGVPNVDVEMLEHIGRSILSKAMEKFGGGGEGLREEGGHARRERAGSVGRDAHPRERSGREHEQRDEERHQRRRSPSRRRDEEEDEHRRRRRRGRHGTDYGPLKTELEALSNTLISLNERQPGHADCEFYDAFVERSGKVQDGIGAVMVQIREREERREERRGRRR
ncbi:hypothetical protein CSOJ01_08025 [Colletotrichum sojae]|uniref:Uncharacterized protein n=1 Tax=Colletotrichum sojae TaxID=2175907 RepID=A0A8H6MTK2_9PEZI|nr:hypothetical protein CSOJ01_08025 [Colletotrichum sojae]